MKKYRKLSEFSLLVLCLLGFFIAAGQSEAASLPAIFNADFNSDTQGAAPGLSPAGPPAGDSITLQDPQTAGNSMLVQGSAGDFATNALEIVKAAGIGNSPIFEGHPDPAFAPYQSGIYIVTWRSLSEQSNGDNGFAALVNSTNFAAFTVNYSADGTIAFQDGSGVVTTGVAYTANVSQTFQALVDLDGRVFDLYIDGVQVGFRQPFQYVQFDGIDRFVWEIGGTIAEAYAIDDISIGTRIFDADFSADTQGQAPNLNPPGIPAGDYITLQNAQTGGNSMLVQADVGDLNTALDIVKAAAVGNSPTFEGHPDPFLGPYTSGSYLVRWKSLAKQSSGMNGFGALVDPSNHAAFTVNYASDGTIVFQDGNGQQSTSVPYAPFTSQLFEAVVDLDSQVFDLYIDGVEVGVQQPFQDAQFSEIDRFFWEIGGTVAETYAISDISIAFQRLPCYFSLTPTSQTGISPLGGPGFNFQVTASDQSCGWTPTTSDSWITGISGGGTGDGMVYYNVSPNGGTVERTGTISAGGQSFSITQSACTYTFTPTSQGGVSSSGGSGFNFSVTVSDPGCTWTATTADSWLGLVSAGPTTGNGTVIYNVSANPGAFRSGTISVGGQNFAVTQLSGCRYSLTPTSQAGVSPSGGTDFSFQVTASSSSCSWRASSNDPWITGVTTPGGTGDGAVKYNVSANTGPARTGSITAAGLTFTVDQLSGCSYAVTPGSPNPADFGTGAGSGTFTVTASSDQCSWTAVSSDSSWLTTTSSGAGSGAGSYAVSTNTGPARTGTISVGGQSFPVNQSSSATVTVIASAGGGGIVSPSGTVIAALGSSRTFFITPEAGFVVADVIVDGRSMGALYAITFMNLMDNHTITVTFAPR